MAAERITGRGVQGGGPGWGFGGSDLQACVSECVHVVQTGRSALQTLIN